MAGMRERTALVTGAGRGIGAAIAGALATQGARVALADVDSAAAQATAEALVAAGHEAMAIRLDVTDRCAVWAAVAAVRERWGAIDILVNNAGICPLRPFEEIDEAEWDRVLAVNLKGAFLCAQAVAPGMRERRYGRIVNLASVAGKMGGLMVGAHYAASKGGLIALTLSLARTYAPYGITVNAVAPGTASTEMTHGWSAETLDGLRRSIPLGRLAQPDDVAAAVVFLAGEAAGYITGEVLDVNGGLLMD